MDNYVIILLLHILHVDHILSKLNKTRQEHFEQNVYEIDAEEGLFSGNLTDYYGRFMEDSSAYEAIEYDLEEIRVTPGLMSCYSCYFSSRFHGRHGSVNCDEPFQPDGIPIVQCHGMCARTRVTLVDGQYMVIRGCMKSCKSMYNGHTTLKCCYRHGCNSARGLLTGNTGVFYWLTLLHLFWIL